MLQEDMFHFLATLIPVSSYDHVLIYETYL